MYHNSNKEAEHKLIATFLNRIFNTYFDYLTHVFKRFIFTCWFSLPPCCGVDAFQPKVKS
jgi:hypothetical protein